ncbi:hypothetical protein Goe17_01640 [Bacillus phage vB_BsuM-Goe17]|nr:hypothetical protein Goe17_01640 [Bacillus phage vB_BsuM-Goe17]
MTHSSAALWVMAELNMIDPESIFEDQEGNQMVFTGKSFQVYSTEVDETEQYVGLCLGDEWTYVGSVPTKAEETIHE